MAEARPWLPGTAFTPQLLDRALGGLLADWSSDWFPELRVGISGLGQPGDARLRAPEQIRVAGDCAMARMDGRGQRHLLEAVFGTGLQGTGLNDADHRVLQSFATCIVESLVHCVDAALHGTSAQPDEQRLALLVSADDIDLLELSVPAASVTPLIKTRIGRFLSKREQLTDRFAALASADVTVEAVLGEAVIGVQDLEGLAVGDVLILGSSIESPIELRLCVGKQSVGRGKLGRVDDRVAVHF